MKTVVAVVETGSFTAASERLNMSKALVSKYVGEVEQHLNVRLFNRSTRRLALTEAGKYYYDHVLGLLDAVEELEDGVAAQQDNPRGLIRISLQVTFGESHLSPLLPTFLARYPDIQVELHLSDRMIDMLEEGIDLVIRMGGVDDSQLIARKITNYPLLLCATPDYLANHPGLKTPDDLAEHQCVIDSNFRVGRLWPFTGPDGTPYSVKVKSRVAANSPRAVRELVAAHAGIGLIPQFVVKDALESGELVQVLPEFNSLSFDMFAIYPHRQYLPQKVRVFVEFLQEYFGDKR